MRDGNAAIACVARQPLTANVVCVCVRMQPSPEQGRPTLSPWNISGDGGAGASAVGSPSPGSPSGKSSKWDVLRKAVVADPPPSVGTPGSPGAKKPVALLGVLKQLVNKPTMGVGNRFRSSAKPQPGTCSRFARCCCPSPDLVVLL